MNTTDVAVTGNMANIHDKRWLVVAALVVVAAHLANSGLVLTNGGTFKVILAFSVPLELPSPLAVNYVHNFQFQYPTVDNASQVSFVQTGQRAQRQRRAVTRRQIYRVIEHMLDRDGVDRSCLLRSVCEAAAAPLTDSGVVGELLQTLLTPYDPQEDSDYSRAWRVGHQGQDCLSHYPMCPHGQSILDHISRYHG